MSQIRSTDGFRPEGDAPVSSGSPFFRPGAAHGKRLGRVLLACGVMLAAAVGMAQTNGVYREKWLNLNQAAGNTLAILTNTALNPGWPGAPDPASTTVFNSFQTEVNDGINYYGQRLRSYIVPPETGSYTFWISSDDTSNLFLSGDENPAGEALIAYVSSYTASLQFTAETTQQSAPISLMAGHRYYIEAIMEQGTGGDNLAVQWQLPDGTVESPIPGNRLQIASAPQIVSQPTNMAVVEGATATFTVGVANFLLPTFQWQLGGTNLPGSTNATLTLAGVTLAQSGAAVVCGVSNSFGAISSSPATLTVSRDTTRPALVAAYNPTLTGVTLVYSKPVNPATASDPSNYSVGPGISVGLVVSNSPVMFTLLVSPGLILGTNYTVTVNGVTDLAAIPNPIDPNSQITFQAGAFIPAAVGGLAPAGLVTSLTNGVDVTAGGSDIGGLSDQFEFDYKTQSGNFDVEVRLQGLSLSSAWAKAGLMARGTLDAGSPFAAAFATPSLAGAFFESRLSAGTASTEAGSFPVNYPNTWLRLKRVANLFTGYAGFDGSNWVQLGSATLTANPVYLGLAVTGNSSNQLALAQFRDYGTVSGGVVGSFAPSSEPLGPSSRRTELVFSEIMYKPAPRTDGLNLEFLEIYNSNPWWDDISGYQLAGEVQYTFPTNTIIPGGGFLLVAAAPADMATQLPGLTNLAGPYTGALKKGGELQLLDNMRSILLDTTYTNVLPWPAGADGTGHSIVLARPTYGEADPRAWAVSDVAGGSPGTAETYRPSPLRNVVINEWLAHHDPGVDGYVELYNHSPAPVDLSGCALTDDATTNKFTVPPGTVIGAGGFTAFTEAQLGFLLKPAGGLLLFKNPDGSRVEDAVSYEAQALGVSFGRWPDGAAAFYPLAAQTPGTGNGGIWLGDIAINEIMYKPISGNDDDQYVELHNHGTNTLHLGGWQFTAGIGFGFPAGTVMAPGGYLVVARNLTNLLAKYPNLNSGNTVGNFSGKLPHKGGRLALAGSDSVVTTNSDGTQTTTTIYPVEDEVTYSTGGRWGQWAHGGGSSLELINPNTNHRLPSNWADSDETAKSSWTNLVFTGLLDNGGNYSGANINLVQAGLLDTGEALVDNLVFQAGTSGPNLIQNPGFENGLANWSLQGDHIRSSLETTNGFGGYQSGHSLHLRSSDGVWTGYNSVQGTNAANSLGSGQTATLRLTGRWLRGSPEVLLRARGNWIELTGAFPIPANLGTPGEPNSQAVASPGPAIFEVSHSPPMPPAGQPVVVTARFHDLGPFQRTLLYRIDSAGSTSLPPSYKSVAMVDNGTGGDALAGDGVYSATIPAQAAGTVAAFVVQATDSGTGATSVFPAVLNDNSGLPRECVVVFGDPVPTRAFGHYHLWMTQNWVNRWGAQGGLSNENNDGTFVDGGGRIIYNITGHYAGSPYHQYTGSPVTTLGGMNWSMPDDDLMLGASSFNKQHVPGNSTLDDQSIQREQTSFWMARQIGMRWDYRRYYALLVNGNRHGPLMEDSQVPDGDMINEYFPNDNNGFLYKNNSWFEFDAGLQSGGQMGFQNNSWSTLGSYTTTLNGAAGQPKLARYRWMYWIRQYPDSASNFTNVFALETAANTSPATALYAKMDALADTEEFMRMSALEHATGDWDSYFCQNQWNMFLYKPLSGKFTALKWDWNITLGNAGSWGPDGGNLFNVGGNDPVMGALQNYPPYMRALLRGFLEIANGPMNPTNANPVLDAKYAAFAAEGLNGSPYNVAEPGANGLKAWIATMHNSLLAALVSKGVSATAFSVSGATIRVANTNFISLSGSAPILVKNIAVNGVILPVTWTTLNNWTLQAPLSLPTNLLQFQGLDAHGNPVPGARASITVTDTTAPPAPPGPITMLPTQLAAGQIVLTWTSVPGQTYLLQYKSDLTALNWSIVGAGIQATGATTSLTDGFNPTNTPRFYRIWNFP